MSYIAPAKSIKLSIPIDLAEFPVSAIPPPGTPGAKNMQIQVTVQTPDGISLTGIFKATSLQKLLAATKDAPQGGFVVMQGKLGPDSTIVEAGCIFQPNKILQPSPEQAGQIPVYA